MQTINETITHIYEVNRSKFIAYLTPIYNFKTLQAQLKKDNPKANHIVYATRELNAFNQVVENSSDDGEPKGCAGVPTLNVLRGNELINVALLTVRYFGGIRLGTGGMVRAYGSAAKEVIAVSPLQPYQKLIEHRFITPYNQVDQVLYHLKQLGITHFEREFGLEDVKWSVKSNEEAIAKLKEIL
jgi:uncharacterized YigZ family protein